MLRAGVLAAAMSILVAACAMVSQPPPPGTRMVQVQVKNNADVSQVGGTDFQLTQLGAAFIERAHSDTSAYGLVQ